MGCGASTSKNPLVSALDPGALRDLSQPNTVLFQEGIAQAGQRNTESGSRKGAAQPGTGQNPAATTRGAGQRPPKQCQEGKAMSASSEPEASPPPRSSPQDLYPAPVTGGGHANPQGPAQEEAVSPRAADRSPVSERSTKPQAAPGKPPAIEEITPPGRAPQGEDSKSDLVRNLDPSQSRKALLQPHAEGAAPLSTVTGSQRGAVLGRPKPGAAKIGVADVRLGSASPYSRSSNSFSTNNSTALTDSQPAKQHGLEPVASIQRAKSTSQGPQPPPPPPAEAAVAAMAAAPPVGPQPRMVDCAVSLQFLIAFSGTVPEDMPTWKVVTDVIVPATRVRQCRYVELIDIRHVGHCDYFISHRWATPFSHLVRYVRKHLVELGEVVEEAEEGNEGDGGGTEAVAAGVVATTTKSPAAATAGGGGGSGGSDGAIADDGDEAAAAAAGPKRRADQVFVWCDIFAINQHPGQVQADDLSQLKDCVEASHQTLLCLDDKGLVLSRIWCLYEIWNTVLAGGPPKLTVLGYDVNQDAFKEVYITLDVAEAQATVDSDRVRILDDIAASTGLDELNFVIKKALLESTQAEAENALRVLLPRASAWREYERVIQAVNKHTQLLTAVGRHQEAQRYGYIIQTVSSSWQKTQADKARTGEAKEARFPTSPASGASPPTAAAAAATASTAGTRSRTGSGGGGECGSGDGDSVPAWHWSQFPREATLRRVLDKAASAERHGNFDQAMMLYREAVSQAEQRIKSAGLGVARERGGGAEGAGRAEGVRPSSGSPATAAPSSSPSPSPSQLHLGLAACRLRLGTFLASRGFLDQAVSESCEPAAAAFELHAGPDSLTFASAAFQAAMLAKNDWQRKDFRGRLLGLSYDIQESQLGPAHEATLDTLREKAEMTYMSGDFAAGVQLFHELAVRRSGGTNLAACPPSGATAAAAGVELSSKALELWFLLATYMSSMAGREDEVVRICRELIPHKRRDHIRRLRTAAADPASEYRQEALAELRNLLGFPSRTAAGSRPPSNSTTPASSGSAGGGRASGGGGVGSMDADPDGMCDPDDPRVDVVSHSAELQLWATVLAKQGRLPDAVLLMWRLAEASRANKLMAELEQQLPTGKVRLVEAYERCLLLDLSVPGIAKVAAKMLTERDGDGGSAAAVAAAAAAAPAQPAMPPLPSSSSSSSEPPSSSAISSYNGPSYMELVQEMTKKWQEMDLVGAEPLCRRIVACQAATHGSVSREVVEAREQLARLLQSAGRTEEAVAEMRAALAVHGQILHGKDPAMCRTLQTLAGMVSDPGEAEQLHQRAVALVTKVHGPDHMEVGSALVQLAGCVMRDAGRMAEGQELMARGLDIHQKFQQHQATRARAF